MEDSIFLLSALFIPGTKTQLGTTNRIFWEVTDGDFSKLPQFVEKYKDENLYFLSGVSLKNSLVPDKDGVLIRKTPDSHVIKKHYFALDFDVRSEFKQEGWEITNEEIKEMGRIMAKSIAGYDPTSIVFTGNGLHIYFMGDVLDPAFQYNPAVGKIFTQFEKILGEPLDHANKNPGRILRLPGSFNNKKGKHTRVEVLTFTPKVSRVYNWIPEIYEKILKEEQVAAEKQQKVDKKVRKGGKGPHSGETWEEYRLRVMHARINFDVPIERVITDLFNLTFNGHKHFHPPGQAKDIKGVFKSPGTNMVCHGGTHLFTPGEKGCENVFTFTSRYLHMSEEDTIQYFIRNYGIEDFSPRPTSSGFQAQF